MNNTRRAFMRAVGGDALAAVPQGAKAAPVGPRFFVAAFTPVDRAGAFDPGLCHDLLAYLRENRAGGSVKLP